MEKKIFRIPSYQRNYAWTEVQLTDLWNDLIFLKKDKNHFFGTILIKELKEKKRISDLFLYRVYEVIDGQQRLTTISILINEILKDMKSTEIEEKDIKASSEKYIKSNGIYLLELLNEDKDFFEDYIIDDKTFPENLIVASRKRLKFAKEIFKKQLKKKKKHNSRLDYQNFLKNLFKKIKSLLIIQYAVKDESDAILIFQTVNDRGIPLSKLEKTKSFLMHIAYLTSPEDYKKYLDTLNKIFSNIFKDMEDIVSSKYGKSLDEESIQQYHYTIYKSYQKKEIQNYFVHLKKYIISLYRKESPECIKFILDYAEDLGKAFSAIKQIVRFNEDRDIKLLIDKIFYLGKVANFYPLLITFWIKFKKEKKLIKNLFQIIEIFSFRVYCIGKRITYTGKTKLYRLANHFNNRIINEISVFNSLVDIVLEYGSDLRFKGNLEQALYDKRDRKDLIYLLFEYEKHLRKDIGEPFEIPLEQYLSKDFDIEHIWAQNPRDLMEKMVEYHGKNVHKLGNLTIAPEGWNKKWGNVPFEEKLPDYKKSILRIQRELEQYEKTGWDHKTIEDRNERLINFCIKRWNIKKFNPSRMF